MAAIHKSHSRSRSSPTKIPSKSKAITPRPVVMIGGRLVGPTLADPELQEAVKKAAESLLPNREAAIKYFVKRGVFTPTGKLTKRAGG